MCDQSTPSRLKAAVTGSLVCGLLGPTIGMLESFAFEAAHQHSARQVLSALGVLPLVWPVAVMVMGPGAFVLGGVGALVIQFMSARIRSTRLVLLQAVVLGLVLGTTVPLTVLGASRNKNFTSLMPLGAATGLVCGALVFWLLRRMRLLGVQQF
jgi:hypothetical protein